MSLSIISVEVTPFAQNARLLYDARTRSGLAIDPGGDISRIIAAIDLAEIARLQIFLTHAHIDHAGGVAGLQRAWEKKKGQKLPLLAHALDRPLRESIARQAQMFGLAATEYENCPEPERVIGEGDTVSVGEYTGKVVFTPGHAPGHVVLSFPMVPWRLAHFADGGISSFHQYNSPFVIAGDTLFAGSIGRTDLPGGDQRTLLQSIQKLLALDDETRVLPGHGPDTTVGEERTYNPWLRGITTA